MKKTSKKGPSKASRKTIKNLAVKPTKGGTVRGGVRKAGEKPVEY